MAFNHDKKKFWKLLRKKKSNKIPPIPIGDFKSFYFNVLTDTCDLCLPEQQLIENQVNEWFYKYKDKPSGSAASIQASQLSVLIDDLQLGSAPGDDKVTSEHLRYGKCNTLIRCLVSFFNIIISSGVVPEVFKDGIIIPILKKPSLDQSNPQSYRPITLTSTLAKLFESCTVTDLNTCRSQFGFKESVGCDMAGALLNDIAKICNQKNSTAFIASMDAEKCFDLVWHAGLFYKLHPLLPHNIWCFYLQWYRCLRARVRIGDTTSAPFPVTRGTRQGSCVSPKFFGIFLDELLLKLQGLDAGVRFGEVHINSLAYADDITLISSTATGMQALLDECEQYAAIWRFRFNPDKTQVSRFGKNLFKTQPVFKLYDSNISINDTFESLGFHYNTRGNANDHLESRIRKTRMAFYYHVKNGLSLPGLSPSAKSCLFKTACQSTLTYGLGAIHYSPTNLKHLDTFQNNIVKQFMGLPKQCRSSNLLNALHIRPIKDLLKDYACNLWLRNI